MQSIIETSRLRLVEITQDDCSLLFKLTGDQHVMRFSHGTLSYDETREMIQKIHNQYDLYGHCFWKVLLKPDELFIGIAGLLHQEIDNISETEISYRILPEHWNKGYATEAAKACKDYAEQILGKNRLISLINPENVASIRVAEKSGARNSTSVDFMGVKHDIYVY